jgi:DNA helicase II / ATP-dependent DNA helicase PcrA
MNLNSEQKKAAMAPNKPLLIVAGAGTGKTRTLTARIAHLIETGVLAGKICALTFTNKAAKEMVDRVETVTNDSDDNKSPTGSHRYGYRHGHGESSPFIGTFHSLCARILRSEAKLTGRNSSFIIFDAGDSFSLLKKIVKELETERQRKLRQGPAFFFGKISSIKNGVVRLGYLKDAGGEENDITVRIFEEYESRLLRNNAFDFDDLIQKVVQIWKKYPDRLQKYREKFTHVLVDEYQDLNNMQYEFIKLLAGESKNLSVVGDDQQMIYGWRYANMEIFFGFERDWPEAQIVLLEENYRSTKNIIQAASALIQNNELQRQKELWTQNADGEPIKIMEFQDEDEEAEFVAEQIQSHNQSHRADSTAVLYRTNAQSRAIEQALIRHDIPYKIFGGIKFYERKEVKDILAGLRYILNPNDELSNERLEKTFLKRRSMAVKEVLSRAKAGNPVKLINIFLEAADYFEYLKRNFGNYDERKENISELIHFASSFPDLSSFLEQAALIQSTDNPEGSKSSRVTLMTVHMAKGLEFDRVFVIGCNEGILPHARSMDSQEELEEERRLMYVAMTRAKKELFLNFYDLASRFLSEIPEEFVKTDSMENLSLDTESNEENYVSID